MVGLVVAGARAELEEPGEAEETRLTVAQSKGTRAGEALAGVVEMGAEEVMEAEAPAALPSVSFGTVRRAGLQSAAHSQVARQAHLDPPKAIGASTAPEALCSRSESSPTEPDARLPASCPEAVEPWLAIARSRADPAGRLRREAKGLRNEPQRNRRSCVAEQTGTRETSQAEDTWLSHEPSVDTGGPIARRR